MAFNGVEVELKFRVNERVAETLTRQLESAGGVQTRQVDRYFDKVGDSFIDKQPIERWLSVRERGSKVILNHKLWHYGPNGAATHCDEAEVLVDDATAAQSLLAALGYAPLITVDKTRTVALIHSYEVSVDYVAQLGYFVEVEATQHATDLETTRAQLETFSKGLGLNLSQVDRLGYPALLLKLP